MRIYVRGMTKKALNIFCLMLLIMASACSKADLCLLEGEGTVVISGIVSDKTSISPLKDMKIVYEAYTTRGKLIDTKTVYSSSDGTYTVESSGYTSEIRCVLKASDSSKSYANGKIELHVDWNGSPYNKVVSTFVVNDCNIYMRKR